MGKYCELLRSYVGSKGNFYSSEVEVKFCISPTNKRGESREGLSQIIEVGEDYILFEYAPTKERQYYPLNMVSLCIR